MSTWHYQLIKHIYPKGEVHYSVHEYYPATEERGEMWTESPVTLWGDGFDDINNMLSCVAQDIGFFNIIEVKHDDSKCVHNAGPLLRRIEELENENVKLQKSLEIYERERSRFRHAKPEMTGTYFLAGGLGLKDENQMPQFVEIVPAYGCGWSQLYEKTDKTINYEGS